MPENNFPHLSRLRTHDELPSRVTLEINLDTLKENFRKIEQIVNPCKVIAVLKANAYGLGDIDAPITKALIEAGAAGFGVAELREALELVPYGKPVQILGNVLPEEIPEAVKAGVILPINDYETAKLISEESKRQGKTTECHFLIDTGMGRLGIIAEQAVSVIREVVKLPNLNCDGIYSHFPVAFRSGSEFTERQVETFYTILDELEKEGVRFGKIHIANSDAINNFSFTYHHPFNYVRTGINLHGAFDNEGQRLLKLKSILALKTKLAAVRLLKKGSTIGYGCTCKLVKDTLVGTISAGYADGLPMALTNRGYVLIRDQLCPVLGRVSMDYTTVSLDFVPDAKVGDEVICLGGEGLNEITVDDWARIKGTHSYDIICSFGNRVARKYVTG